MSENIKSITVSQLNRYVYRLLSSQSVLNDIKVRGELSNVKVYSSGHYYFNLKDENTQVSCVMFRGNTSTLSFKPKDGDSVIVRAKASLYERDGKFQLYVSEMQADGKGNLFLLYEQLKKKLAAEGLFRQDLKKALPKMPKVIGVATSRSGAVIQDIINVSKRRFPLAKIILAPCSVQGDNAAPTIVNAIRQLDSLEEVDVIIVGRGGGSMEDLWCFNEEIVARAVFECNKPIISAVGHETDVSICDFVADLRAPTPSAAAELALPNQADILAKLEQRDLQFIRYLNSKFERYESNLSSLKSSMRQSLISSLRIYKQKFSYLAGNKYLINPYENINTRREIVDSDMDKLEHFMRSYLDRTNRNLEKNILGLDALSPLKILSRGYAMVTPKGEFTPLLSSKNLQVNDELKLHMSDGAVEVLVNRVESMEAN